MQAWGFVPSLIFFFFLQASVYFSVGEGFVLIENSESLTVLQLQDLFTYI